MFFMVKMENVCPVYVSKNNSKYEKKVILSMIPNKVGCHYNAAKNGRE